MKIIAEIERYESNATSPCCYWKKGDIKKIKCNKFYPCCKDAKEAWSERFINFGDFDAILNTDQNVCIYMCEPWPEGAIYESMTIHYCPFCGTKIQIIFENI